MARDYYEILGVDRGADDKEIKRAFHRQAKQYHPDVNKHDPNAETRFKEINQAYEVLSDPERRQMYDRFGPDFENYRQGAGPTGGGPYAQTIDPSAFEDLMSSFFGGMGGEAGFGQRRRRAQPDKGRDIEHPVSVSLREAFEGTTRYITRGDRRVRADIPAGVTDGTRVRLRGEGEPGRTTPGDLYLIVTVEPDMQFTRDGKDLTTEVKVDLFTAMLGGQVTVPLATGSAKMTIPPGTQSGRKFRLSGRGMPGGKGKAGDLYARVLITVPETLTDEQRKLVEKLRDSLS